MQGSNINCNYVHWRPMRKQWVACFWHFQSILVDCMFSHLCLPLPFNLSESRMGRRRRRSNGRAVIRCVRDAFSDAAALAAAPVNHDYNSGERWRRWCRKSSSDNYNARDKIMGTHCTLPIISCISCRLTPPFPTDNRQSQVIFVKSKMN